MGYLSAGEIISDAAAELGLGTVTDAFGSIDANVIQLRGLLKSGGRKLIRDRDWSHLRKEYSFVSRPNWAANTTYTALATPWGAGNPHSVGDHIYAPTLASFHNIYQCTTAGISASGGVGPIAQTPSIVDGTCIWKYLNSGTADIVVKGLYWYTCATSGTSGTVGPYGDGLESQLTEGDGSGSLIWTWGGRGSDYPLPSDFSNLIDQTGWNRTNALPVGGPVDGQVWQYLKGRSQGIVFNVLFRPVAGLLRLYPDTDMPGGYAITFEYTSSWWTGGASSTAPTADAPTVNGDLVYFDPVLMTARLKLDWLGNKGFDTTLAQREYDDCLEESMNSDGSAPVLNLQGRGPYDPLVGAQNVPWTGFGS